LASGSQDNSIRIWEIESGKELKRLDLPDGKNQKIKIACVTFSLDGKEMAASYSQGDQNLFQTWDADTFEPKDLRKGSSLVSQRGRERDND